MEEPIKTRQYRNWPSITGTIEQRASRGLTRLEDLTRLISEWVWEADPKGRITYVSERVSEQLGFLPIQIIGKKFTELGVFVTHDEEPFEPNWNNPFREVLFKTPDKSGIEKLFLISSVPYFDPDTWNCEGVTGVAEDVTERMLKEKTLHEALDAAEHANKAKSEFLATINHELRTPLTSIRGSIGLLREFLPKELPEEALSLLEISKQNTDTLLILINDLLDFEKSLSGMMKLDMTPHDIVKLTEDTVGLNESYAKAHNVRFNYEPGSEEIWANVDEHRYAQILRNLLSNAAKFSHAGGQVDISVTKEKECVRIAVQDYGLGISTEDQTSIFDRFVQVDSADTRMHTGSGLGLAICQALTEAMGGSIDIQSAEGNGSTFFVKFPILSIPPH